MSFERVIKFRPAFDKRHPDASKNYGINGMELQFYLKGPKGAIQFILGTGMQLKHVKKEHELKGYSGGWMAYDIGYHSPVPRYEGQTPMDVNCEWTGDEKCYYDGSSLQADEIAERFIAEGEDYLWPELERQYKMRLEDNED